MFVDRVKVRVTAGNGGKGCCSFRREKYIPFGGPDGGDGGDGGNVIFKASARLNSLMDLKFHAHWKAEAGIHGKGSDMHGRRGHDTVIPVPCGTIVCNFETGEPIADLTEDEQEYIAARGGKGGKGNARFTTSTNRAPKFAEMGEPGEELEYIVELKLIAEVGIVGKPNAGKSTLLSVITSAKPKIADYPFTTLTPNLGVCHLSDFRILTVADIPGIIEGAAQGKGLGHDFLRHIERTRVLLFVVDLGDPDPIETLATLEEELAEYSDVFATRPRVIAFNKADVTENIERYENEIKAQYPDAFCISAAANQGLDELLEVLFAKVELVKKIEAEEIPMEDLHAYVYEAPYQIYRDNPSTFRVEGERIIRAVRMTNFDNDEAVRHLQKTLTKMGVVRSLKRLGAKPGHTVVIGDEEMEYQPEELGIADD